MYKFLDKTIKVPISFLVKFCVLGIHASVVFRRERVSIKLNLMCGVLFVVSLDFLFMTQ